MFDDIRRLIDRFFGASPEAKTPARKPAPRPSRPAPRPVPNPYFQHIDEAASDTGPANIRRLIARIVDVKKGEDWRDALLAGDQQRGRELKAAQMAFDTLNCMRPDTLPYLLAQLGSGSYMVRALLKHIGEPAVEPLLDCLESDEEAMRADAALTLGELKDPRAVEPLLALLAHDDPALQFEVVSQLGFLGDERAVQPLTDLFNQTANKPMRQQIRRALRRLGHPPG